MQSLSHCSLIDGGQDTVNLCLANLVLTGAATPWLHNGAISVRSLNTEDQEDQEERIGITERFLFILSYVILTLSILETTLVCSCGAEMRRRRPN